MFSETSTALNIQSDSTNVVAFNDTATSCDIERKLADLKHYQRGTDADSTVETYLRGNQKYQTWCDETGRDNPILRLEPCNPIDVAAFIDDMSQTLKPATVATYVAALDRAHRDAGAALAIDAIKNNEVAPPFPAPSDNQIVRLAKRRMRRKYGTAQKQAAPMSADIITHALKTLGDTLPELRDIALIWLAFDSMARASEIIALNVSDLKPVADGAATISIGSSKTDQEGEGQERFVSAPTMRALERWIEAAKLGADSPLFIPVSQAGKSDRLARQDIGRMFKRRIGQKYSAHSTRVGSAVDQMYWKETTAQIMQAGGWKTAVMVARYTKSLDALNSASAGLARKQGRI